MNTRRLLLMAPLGVAVVGGVAFRLMLRGLDDGTFDPRGVPNPLVGKRLRDFPALPPQSGKPGFSSEDILAANTPMLVNFFASWCEPCLIEHPVLMSVAATGLPIWGIAYKDRETASAAFLSQRGNPYARIGRDAPGQVAIDWGVYGVPESYLVDRGGIVRWRWPGPITREIADQQLLPLVRRMS